MSAAAFGGATCYGFCDFLFIDWHVVLDYMHLWCIDIIDVYRIGSSGLKSGRLES